MENCHLMLHKNFPLLRVKQFGRLLHRPEVLDEGFGKFMEREGGRLR